MNILFLHPNFPGQFLQLASYLARDGKNHVVFISKQTNKNRLRNVNVMIYQPAREPTPNIHPYVKPLEEAALDGQAVVRAMMTLQKKHGFRPDIIIGHTGWGSTLYVKDIYPDVPLIGYFEWYYLAYGSDTGYWPDEIVSDDNKLRIRTLNASPLLNLEACDVRYCPTKWQHSQFPAAYRNSIKIIHEGIDTEFYQPEPSAVLTLKDINLSGAKEIITYVSRGLEPYRGFPQFMDALRLLLPRRPDCHVIIVGDDRSCYGPKPAPDKTWKQLEEATGGYDVSRVHFTGLLSRQDYLNVLQASTVHVYLTRPFVLSWSALEAMSSGCCMVASATPPVEEVITDGENGLLVNFRSPEHIASRIEEALDDAALRHRLGQAARETILERYQLKNCLRQQLNMIHLAMK